MKSTSRFNWKVQLAFMSAILILLVVGGISYRAVVLSNESEQWVRHTHEVIENLESEFSTIQDIVTSSRTFVLIGDEKFLEPYHSNVLRAAQEARIIRALTADNPGQGRRLDTLAGLAEQRIKFDDAVIRFRQTKGLEAAVREIRDGQGMQVMDEIRAVIGEMEDEERRLLLLRDAESERRSRQTKAVVILGNVLGLLIAVAAGQSVRRDSAARELAEQALREGEERFRTLANNISQLAWMADEKGWTFWYNERWFEYTGATKEDMAGWGWQKVQHPDHVQRVVEKISQCFQKGETWEDMFPLRSRDGTYRWFLSRAVPIRDQTGKVLRWFGTNTDITERKSIEEDLAKKVVELKHSNDELEQFAYVASHDLQEPLRMVASYTQLLSKRYKGRLDSEADEFIGYAVDGSTRMQTLIQDLLAYSRAGTTNGKAYSRVSCENALKEALMNLEAAVAQGDAVVTHDSLPTITTDGAQLVQVFQNLIGNAIKYHGVESPRVHVSASKNGGSEWIFSVRDNGMGIDPEQFDRIFVIFQRLHGRGEFEGTGIGLAICKKILEQQGGRIWVESEPQKGSTFHFALLDREEK